MKKTEVDPRALFNAHPIASMEDIEVGDWVRASSWSRLRRVVELEKGAYIVLAEPDESRQDEHRNRRVDRTEFHRRAWLSAPAVRELWESFRQT